MYFLNLSAAHIHAGNALRYAADKLVSDRLCDRRHVVGENLLFAVTPEQRCDIPDFGFRNIRNIGHKLIPCRSCR